MIILPKTNNPLLPVRHPANSVGARKVIVAMSGGVDSSVSAVLLKQAGSCAESGRSFDVAGIYMRMCGGKKDLENLARAVAKKIGISFYAINVEKEFKKKVIDYFLSEYKKGNTPNPCVVCNKEIKFGFLIKKALSLGADYVATGHYARTSLAPLSGARLFMGKDREKDQSYFLWQLNQDQLKRVLFPVGEYTKPEVRKLAKKFKLPIAETPESQEVCFVSQTTNDFLKKYLKTKPGKILDISGKELGQHQGLWFYTIGQRRGIACLPAGREVQQGSASAQKGSGETKPYYVVAKDFKKNNLIVSKNKKDLEKKELIANNVNWILPVKLPIIAEVKIRYKSGLFHALIRTNKPRGVKVIFQKQSKGYPKAITPGQSAVFYRGSELLGGGIIN